MRLIGNWPHRSTLWVVKDPCKYSGLSVTFILDIITAVRSGSKADVTEIECRVAGKH